MMIMEKVRLRIRFYGEVQGVGFRYRAYHSANSLGITGNVRNCYDGTVLCEVQGYRQDIDEMIKMISDGTYIDITDMDTEQLPLSEDEYDFRITDSY